MMGDTRHASLLMDILPMSPSMGPSLLAFSQLHDWNNEPSLRQVVWVLQFPQQIRLVRFLLSCQWLLFHPISEEEPMQPNRRILETKRSRTEEEPSSKPKKNRPRNRNQRRTVLETEEEPFSQPKKEPSSKPKPKKNRPRCCRKERAVEWDQQKQHWLLLGCDCDGVVLCSKMAMNESPWLAGLVSQSEKVGVPLSLWTRQWVCQSEKVGMPFGTPGYLEGMPFGIPTVWSMLKVAHRDA
jgi:hypothetical protein